MLVLGLVTEGTMEPVYAGLIVRDFDMSGVTTFNLDEYVGLSPSSLMSRTRVKTLTRHTHADNARFFGPDEQVPHFAITMGIATIMQARRLVILARGAAKAKAVAPMVEGPVTAICPASIIQMHPSATVVIDESAASNLALRDYYETVHPGGTNSNFRSQT